ncbi:DapH/DapD/GlmU-related protein [Rhodoferax sp.]|uniref:DapH/DapD/GlmU-related protein n=1 Tax=Rhodoferax sp. TaxID=50421 RepID=UPI0025E6978A|nr:DapH/DapD/GlmU-related protein [Rhodoferax sp.]
MGSMLDWALSAWAELAPELELRKIVLSQDKSHAFDLSELQALQSEDGTAFVAMGHQFLNYRRFELMGMLKAMGFKMPPLVCCGAVVAASARVGENSFIGSGALVGVDADIGFNCVVGAGANIGASTKIGNSAWLAPGVLVGATSSIGAHTIVGMGVLVRDGVQIGKQCVLEKHGPVATDVVAKTFHLASFADPVVIFGS